MPEATRSQIHFFFFLPQFYHKTKLSSALVGNKTKQNTKCEDVMKTDLPLTPLQRRSQIWTFSVVSKSAINAS